ncbi:hypothetical protein B2G52_04150 [Neisseria lactamica]|uniref:Uncharacterized protein n=1 Tax=Neisseria lactamica TaxID=486 RepID=A0AAU8VJ08_NEILA|nr:hypothetical protein B2G52_04150 [Neisseria lactamica]
MWKVGRVVPPKPDFHRIPFSVETPPLGHLSFGAVESEFIWEGRNPFQIRATHRAVLYVSSCVLKHCCVRECGQTGGHCKRYCGL